ncbi:hypothetical protein [Microbacterium terrisoli]|uniref:hypothetical protein n=1 Tax=Microbacterium terrisoli TaxID=3242192 RepID=UPI0028039A09|nr:hypothetical protein [Microbacterium protaetiae]
MSDFPSSGDVVITDGTRAETGVITKRGHVTTDRAAGKLQSQAALAACGWTNWTAPFTWPVKWWLTRGCSLIGTTASATAGYTIDVDINSLGGACHQVYGYHLTPVSSGGYQYTGFWTGTGCINPGGDSGWTVPWGNVAAVKQLYAKTTGGAAGSAGMFK